MEELRPTTESRSPEQGPVPRLTTPANPAPAAEPGAPLITPDNPAPRRSRWGRVLGQAKRYGEILQSWFTVAAIIAGGWWFFAQRSTKPLLKLDESITVRTLAAKTDYDLVVIEVKATNVGKVGIELPAHSGAMDLRYVSPEPPPQTDGLLGRAELKQLSLEPGESNQALVHIFYVPRTVSSILVHSYYKVPDSANIWTVDGVFDLGPAAHGK